MPGWTFGSVNTETESGQQPKAPSFLKRSMALRYRHHPRSASAPLSAWSSPQQQNTTAKLMSFEHSDKQARSIKHEDEEDSIESSEPAQHSWFSFPPEIRNLVYGLLMHWPDCRELYQGCYAQLDAYYARRKKDPTAEFPVYQPRLHTPTILLLCRTITRECLPILKAKRLIVDRIPPVLPGGQRLMSISQFIGIGTLQNLHHVDIRIGLGEGELGSGWVWIRILDELLDILSVQNSFRKLRLLIRLCNTRNPNIWRHETRILYDIKGKKMPKFISENPNIWAEKEVVVDEWLIIGGEAHFLNSTRDWSEENLQIDEEPLTDEESPTDEEPPRDEEPPMRRFPDPEMFPGSIMEFLREEVEDVRTL